MLRRGERIGRQPGKQFGLLPQVVAQYTIDQATEATLGQLAGCRDGLVDHGMDRIGPGIQPVQRNQQQATHLGRIQRTGQQAAKQEIAASIATQAAIDQVLHGGTGNRVDAAQQVIGQALPGKHGSIDAGGVEHGEGKRIERQSGHRCQLSHAA